MTTISTHNGSKVAYDHNIRNRAVTDKEKHIDRDGYYAIWRDVQPETAYGILFDEAIEAYNAQQTRSDRQIRNYYRHIKQDAKKHPVYEMIATVGSKADPVDPTMGREILLKFAQGWADRNPHLCLIGAYYHADEDGAPHVHLDYIPWADGYTRGPERQTGLVKALGQQGLVKKGRETAQIRWERQENKALETICREYGLEIEHPMADKGVQHLHTTAYKAQQELKQTQQELDAAKADLQVTTALSDISERLQAPTDIPEPIRSTPERKTIFGRIKPATATLRQEDYAQLRLQAADLQTGQAAAGMMSTAAEKMAAAAAETIKNRDAAMEDAVDRRVRGLRYDLKEARERQRAAESRAASYDAQSERVNNYIRDLEREIIDLQNALRLAGISEKALLDRTKRARELEEKIRDAKVARRVSDMTNQMVKETEFEGKKYLADELQYIYSRECAAKHLTPAEEYASHRQPAHEHHHGHHR